VDVKAQAAALREQGMTFREIAEITGRHLSTVHRWVVPASAQRNLTRQRERRNGPVFDRECGGYGCHTVILASEHPNKRFCSASCRARAHRMRHTA
jgi:hypothetical protein